MHRCLKSLSAVIPFLLSLSSIIVVANCYAQPSYVDDRRLLLSADSEELGGLNYGHFLTCLKTVDFGGGVADRKIDTQVKRLVFTELEGDRWFFEIRQEIGAVIIEDITVNTHHYSQMAEKRRLLLHLFAHCQIEEDPKQGD